MSEVILKGTELRRVLISQCPTIYLALKVCFSLSLFLPPGVGVSQGRSLVGVENAIIENDGADNFPMNLIQRQEDDLELMEEIAIFAPPGVAEQTQHVSYLEEMQVTMEKTTHVISQGADDSWVPAVSALVIVLIVFSISVFACCLHCPFCCVYRMNDPHRIAFEI
ncbi:unnamed protein product [Allacma fusca]|uniref:Uncharacterized protein n=1 Tax=Allacma fusca TaxID=39272 RepID=A0A8J2JKM2_9HEXA|nr:unnamed protein product [Allacma fusca]